MDKNLLSRTVKGFIGLFQKVAHEQKVKTGMSEEEVKEATALWKNKKYRILVKEWEKDMTSNK